MNPKRQSKTSPVPARTDLSGWQLGDPGGGENGFIIIAVIALIAILALVGTVAVMTTTTEIKISSNYKTGVQAFHAAQAGAEEARARLRGSSDDDDYAGDPASPDPTWSAYILTSDTWQLSDDPDYAIDTYKKYIPLYDPVNHTNTATETNTIQTTPPDISYWVKIRHKREYDAEQDGHDADSTHYYDNDGDPTFPHTAAAPGNIIYYGYGNPSTPTTAVQFATSTTTIYKPVEIITSYGSSGSSSQIIKTEVVRSTGPPIVAAVYSKEDTTINGASATIDGTDSCGDDDALPPIYLFDGDGATLTENPAPAYGGDPPTPQIDDEIDIDIEEYVNMLKDAATEIITSDQSGTPYGDTSTFVTCYSNTSDPPNVQGLKLSSLTGYGILLVEGDLTLGGAFNWNGLILVTGELTFNGGGLGINILGAVLANQAMDVDGGVNIQYNSCMIDKSFNSQPVNVIRWEDKKLK
jgi:hypothetical protein